MTVPPTMLDSRRTPFTVGDQVRVVAYGGGARLTDCGHETTVLRFNRTRAVVTTRDGDERAVDPDCLMRLAQDLTGRVA